MQFCVAMILLHRPTAKFERLLAEATEEILQSREVCVQRATEIITMVEDYERHHGSANSMFGTVLYNVTLAGTILIANLSDPRSLDNRQCLKNANSCLRILKDLNSSYIVARPIRKQLKQWMARSRTELFPSDAEAIRYASEFVQQKSTEAQPPLNNLASSQSDFALMGGVDLPSIDLDNMRDCGLLRSINFWDQQS